MTSPERITLSTMMIEPLRTIFRASSRYREFEGLSASTVVVSAQHVVQRTEDKVERLNARPFRQRLGRLCRPSDDDLYSVRQPSALKVLPRHFRVMGIELERDDLTTGTDCIREPDRRNASGIGAVDQERIQDSIANRIKAKKALILLDTCESGALTQGYSRSRQAPHRRAVRSTDKPPLQCAGHRVTQIGDPRDARATC